MTGTEEKIDRKSRVHSTKAPQAPSEGPTNLSLQAYRALREHAQMFEASGPDILEDDGRTIVLADGPLKFHLGYRSQRKLLARVDHLRVTLEVAAAGPKASSCELQLKRGGPLGGTYGFTILTVVMMLVLVVLGVVGLLGIGGGTRLPEVAFNPSGWGS